MSRTSSRIFGASLGLLLFPALLFCQSLSVKSVLELAQSRTLSNMGEAYAAYSFYWNEDLLFWDSCTMVTARSVATADAENFIVESFVYEDQAFRKELELEYHNYKVPPGGQDCGSLLYPGQCEIVLFPIADSITYSSFYDGDTSRGVYRFHTNTAGLVDRIEVYCKEDGEYIPEAMERHYFDANDHLTDYAYLGYGEYDTASFSYNTLGLLSGTTEFSSWDGGNSFRRSWVTDYTYDAAERIAHTVRRTYEDSLAILTDIDSTPVSYFGNSVMVRPTFGDNPNHPGYDMVSSSWEITTGDSLQFEIHYAGSYNFGLSEIIEKRYNPAHQLTVQWEQRTHWGADLANSYLTVVDYGEGVPPLSAFLRRNIAADRTVIKNSPVTEYQMDNYAWLDSGWTPSLTVSSQLVSSSRGNDLVVERYRYDPDLGFKDLTSQIVYYNYRIPGDFGECVAYASDQCPYTSFPYSALDHFRHPFADSIRLVSYADGDSTVTLYLIHENAAHLVEYVEAHIVNPDGTFQPESEAWRFYDDRDRMTHCTLSGSEGTLTHEQQWEYNDADQVTVMRYLSYDPLVRDINFSSETHYSYDANGMLRSVRYRTYCDSLFTVTRSDSSHYIYLTERIGLERRYDPGFAGWSKEDRWMVNEADTNMLAWHFLPLNAMPAIWAYHEETYDSEGRRTEALQKFDMILTGRLENDYLSKYKYELIPAVEEVRTSITEPTM